jgi:hypothetical protein
MLYSDVEYHIGTTDHVEISKYELGSDKIIADV